MPDEVAPAGSGVGELGTSVRFPPLTANTDTKLLASAVDQQVLAVGGQAGVDVGSAAVDGECCRSGRASRPG